MGGQESQSYPQCPTSARRVSRAPPRFRLWVLLTDPAGCAPPARAGPSRAYRSASWPRPHARASLGACGYPPPTQASGSRRNASARAGSRACSTAPSAPPLESRAGKSHPARRNGHQPRRARQRVEQLPALLPRQHRRQPPPAPGELEAAQIARRAPQGLAAEEHQRVQRLLLRRNRHPPAHRQLAQNELDSSVSATTMGA